MEDRKYILLALLYALLLFPGHYAYKLAALPENTVLIADTDGTYLGTVKSALWGLATPWPGPDVSIFTDVTLGSAFAFLPVTAVWLATGIDPWIVMILLNALFTFAYLAIILKIMQRLLPGGEWKYAFPILLFANGIGGLLYFPLSTLGRFTEAGLGNLFWGWMTSAALYQTFTLFTGYAAFLALLEGRNRTTTTLMFLTFLVYPIAGVLFSCMIIAYSLFTGSLRVSLKVVAPSLAALLPWMYFISMNVVPYLKLSAFYATPILAPEAFILTVLINSGIAVLLAGYAVSRKGFFGEGHRKFLCEWAAALLAGIFLQAAIKGIDVSKLLVMYWVPLSMMAGIGLVGVASRLKIRPEFAFMAVVALSLPSFALFWGHNGAVVTSTMDRDVYESLLFLRSQSQGTVLAEPGIGRYVPYIAEKRSLTGAPLPDPGALAAYDEFLSGNYGILQERNISYIVMQGSHAGSVAERIYSSGNVSVYRVKEIV